MSADGESYGSTKEAYYDQETPGRIQFVVGDLVLLSTQNLRLQGHST